MKRLLIILTIFLISQASAQQNWNRKRDSLLNCLHQYKEDTNKVKTLLSLCLVYVDNQPDSAAYFSKLAVKISEDIHYQEGIAQSLGMQAAALSAKDSFDEAIHLYIQSIKVAQKIKNPLILADTYNNLALTYSFKGEYNMSIDYYLKAVLIYEQLNKTSRMQLIYANISGVYNAIKEYKKGYDYALKSIRLYRLTDKLNNARGLSGGLINLGQSLLNLKRFDTALIVLLDAKGIAKKNNEKNQVINVLTSINEVYSKLKKFDSLKNNAFQIIALAKEIDFQEGFCYASLDLVNYYLSKKNYSKASDYAQTSVKIAKQNNLLSLLKDSYTASARVSMEMGNIDGFDTFSDLKDSIEDILLNDKILKNTQDLEARYSLNKKQNEIDKLNSEKVIQQLTIRQNSLLNWILASIVFFTGLISYLFYRNYHQKKKLFLSDAIIQQKKITELEREKQFLAAQSVMQGQIEERERLAKDLHDGLGGILSSAKYSFRNIKDNMIISPEFADTFERSMGMLDNSIIELRRVAHNMMPESLVKFGLDTALKDFCGSINQSGVIQLTYQSFELNESSISKITSSALYRVIQELINNILKHAKASTALVQLIRKENSLSITVEDNGQGFDTGILANSEGMGYQNLKNRVDYLNGSMDVNSSEGNGTSVNIEIPNISK